VARGEPSRGDFVGWTGIGPIAFFIEYAIGLRADAIANRITWDIRSAQRLGVERFWFGGKTVSFVCEGADAAGARTITIESDGAFRLTVNWNGKSKTVEVSADKQIQVRL
jgi:hypothetical protein